MTQELLTAEPPATSTRYVVELRNVGMKFNDKQVLDNVSLVVDPQQRLVIIGQSGAGKTTILRLTLIGSVAEHVVRYADCPVIVVPSRSQAES